MQLVYQSTRHLRKSEAIGLRDRWPSDRGWWVLREVPTRELSRASQCRDQTPEALRWGGRHKERGRGEFYQHNVIQQTMLPCAGSIDRNQLHALLSMTKNTNFPPHSRLGNNSFSMSMSQDRPLYKRSGTK